MKPKKNRWLRKMEDTECIGWPRMANYWSEEPVGMDCLCLSFWYKIKDV